MIYADARSTEVTEAIRIWLKENYRQRGYTPLIGALHNHPKVWQALLATRRLDKRIIADFQNYRAETGRQLEQLDAK